jgi:hypothetical protein
VRRLRLGHGQGGINKDRSLGRCYASSRLLELLQKVYEAAARAWQGGKIVSVSDVPDGSCMSLEAGVSAHI